MKPEITYYKSGQIKTEMWRDVDGKDHRLDGPARQYWFENGQLEWEVWCVNGKYHRLDGPAYQAWLENGQLIWRLWYISGVKYETEAEFQVAVDLYKANEIAELF